MENQSKILADKISSKLSKIGVSSDLIETDRAAQKGDASAQYLKACQLLGRRDCKLPVKNGNDSNNWSLRDKLEGEVHVFSSLPLPNNEWFEWLLKSAKAGHKQALEDILFLINWPPFIQDPELVFEVCKVASRYPEFTYIDQFGDNQPYALKVAQMYWTGRVHIPSVKDWAVMRHYNDRIGYRLFDSRLDSNSGEGLPLKSKNIIG